MQAHSVSNYKHSGVYPHLQLSFYHKNNKSYLENSKQKSG